MMTARVLTSLFGLAASALGVGIAAGSPLGAQLPLGQPEPQPASGGHGLGELIANPGKWLADMFNDAVVNLGQQTTSQLDSFLAWLMGGNIMSQTPPALSYANPAVKSIWEGTALVAGGALVVVAVWGGFNVMLKTHIRAPYHGALELGPRVLLAGVMVMSSLSWCSFVIDLNNAVCQSFGGAAMPAWTSAQQIPGGQMVLLNLIAAGVYFVMGLLLAGQMLMRLALVDVLLVVAPLALVCWVLPQTYSWARLWFTTFFGTVFVQAIQVLVLRLGSGLIVQLPILLLSLPSNPLNTVQLWLMTLLLGIAVLQLARKVPRLVSSLPGGMASGGSGLIGIRQITSVFNASNDKKGRR